MTFNPTDSTGLPVPSPDGRRLAWTSNRHGERGGQIYLADWDHEAALRALDAAPERLAAETGRRRPGRARKTMSDGWRGPNSKDVSPAPPASGWPRDLHRRPTRAHRRRAPSRSGEHADRVRVHRRSARRRFLPPDRRPGRRADVHGRRQRAGARLLRVRTGGRRRGVRRLRHPRTRLRRLRLRQLRDPGRPGQDRRGPAVRARGHRGRRALDPEPLFRPALQGPDGAGSGRRGPARRHGTALPPMRAGRFRCRFDTAAAGSGVPVASIGGAGRGVPVRRDGDARWRTSSRASTTATPHVAGFDLPRGPRHAGTPRSSGSAGPAGTWSGRCPAPRGQTRPGLCWAPITTTWEHGHGGNSLAREHETGQVHPRRRTTTRLASPPSSRAAAALARTKHRRPVALAFWSGEELGLLGSSPLPAGRSRSPETGIAAYINLDMVGRVREKPAERAGRRFKPPTGRGVIEAANVPVGFDLALQGDPYLPTDSATFYNARHPHGEPLQRRARGLSPGPADSPDKLDYEALRGVARFNRPAGPAHRRPGRTPPPSRGSSAGCSAAAAGTRCAPTPAPSRTTPARRRGCCSRTSSRAAPRRRQA